MSRRALALTLACGCLVAVLAVLADRNPLPTAKELWSVPAQFAANLQGDNGGERKPQCSDGIDNNKDGDMDKQQLYCYLQGPQSVCKYLQDHGCSLTGDAASLFPRNAYDPKLDSESGPGCSTFGYTCELDSGMENSKSSESASSSSSSKPCTLYNADDQQLYDRVNVEKWFAPFSC